MTGFSIVLVIIYTFLYKSVLVVVTTLVDVSVIVCVVRQGPGVEHVVWDGAAIHVGIRPTMHCDGAVQFGHRLFGADTFPV